MKTELVPRDVGDILPFSVATCDHLEKPGRREVSETTYGQVFKDGLLAWLANGASLEVVSTRNGERHGSWEFGVDHPEAASIKITCVAEVKESQGSRMVVGLDNGRNGGLVCILNINASKIVKVIAVPQKVTSMEIISPMGGVNPYNFLLCQELRYLYGVLAVGMQDGGIYLIDLMLDDFNYSNECDPSELTFFTKQTHNLPNKREDAMAHGEHLTLYINDGCESSDWFQFRTPANGVSNSFSVDDVYVSALLYARPNGCLMAGFSFGGFQIWDLNRLELVYTSSFQLDSLPVIRLTFQEPDNDPRNFCYLWVVRGLPINEIKQDRLVAAALYSLSFEQKGHTEGFGQCYQEFISCVPRFDFDLNHDPMQVPCSETVASRLISCMTIEEMTSRYHIEPQPHANLSVREEGNGCSLCLFVWESTFIDPNIRPRATLAIFDLNQWYQAQMPSKIRFASIKLCPYFGFYSLSSITEKGLPDFLLDVYIPSQSIHRMQTNSKAEQFFYPSSLAFDAISLFDTGIIHAPFLGLQRQVMLELKRIGPSFLLNPNDAFQICMCSSLLPLNGESQPSSLSLTGQRESLLSMALEYEMIDLLVSCISEWASGQYTIEGCTLRFIQDWAWKRVYQIKTLLDKQCVSLFDCSGLRLDTLTVQSLCHQVGQLKNLELVFRTLLNQCQAIPTTDHGAKELEYRGNVISLLVLYLEVILWFLNYGLLPENDEDDDCGSTGIAYPSKLLSRIYSKRRAEIQRLSSTVGPRDLLFIDGLVAHVDDSLPVLWERNGGDGLYPPPSLHALLNSYLLPNVSSTVKHQIVQYLFLDLAELLDSEHYANVIEKLVTFPAAFSLSPSCIKLTQGFWLLDHKAFEEAISMLLHPMVNVSDICSWQHSRVMKAFLYQGEPKKALTYARVRRPSLQTAEDVRFHLTLLLANSLVGEAYHYQKSVRNQGNAEDLLQHFFLGCQQTDNLRDLLNLPLSPLEEGHLVDFLNNCSEPQAREILVIYYLQRSRYVDAMQLNERLVPRVMHEADPAARERAITRNSIVDGFSKLLPHVYDQITHSAKHLFISGKDTWLRVPRPQPLSTKVIAFSQEPMSQSNLIETVMGQITSVWSMPQEDYTPFRRSSTKSDHRLNVVPLIGTPISTKKSLTEEDRLTLPVFPTVVGKDVSGLDLSLYHVSPAKKARFLDVNPAHLSPSGRRQSSSYYNAEALSLLQTPPVRRKAPSSRSSAVKTVTPGFTPQSILKVHLKNKPLSSTSEFIPEKTILSLAVTPDILDGEVTPSSSPEYKLAQDKSESRHLRFQFSSSNDESQTSSPEESFVEAQPSINEVGGSSISSANSPISSGLIEDCPASPRRPLYSKQSSDAFDDSSSKANANSTSIGENLSINSDSSQSIEELELEGNRMNLDDEENEELDSVVSVSHQRYKDSDSDTTTDDNSTSFASVDSARKSQSSAVLQVYAEGVDLVVQDASSDGSTSEEVTHLNKERSHQEGAAPLSSPEKTVSVKVPAPRSMSFFSAERGKEHFLLLAKELAKQSGKTNFDLNNADLEIVETESPLASLVNKTLDSVFSTHSDLPSMIFNKSSTPSTVTRCTSKAAPVFSALNDRKLFAPLSVDVQDLVSSSPELPSPSLVSQCSPKTRSQTAREKEALQQEIPSIRRSPRKSSSLSPKTLKTSPSTTSRSPLGKKSPAKVAELSKSKISKTPKKSATFGATEYSQKEVSAASNRKSPSLSASLSSPFSSTSQVKPAAMQVAESPNTLTLTSGEKTDSVLLTETNKQEVNLILVSGNSPTSSPELRSKSVSTVREDALSPDKSNSSSCLTTVSPVSRSRTPSGNIIKDTGYQKSTLSHQLTPETKEVEMAEVDHDIQNPQDFNMIPLTTPPAASQQENVSENEVDSVDIRDVSILHPTLSKALSRTSVILGLNQSDDNIARLHSSDDSISEPKEVRKTISVDVNLAIETEEEDTLTSFPMHPPADQEQDRQEMTPIPVEIELINESNDLRTPDPEAVTGNASDYLSRLLDKPETRNQNTSTTSLNLRSNKSALETESQESSRRAKVDKNTSTTLLDVQTPNLKRGRNTSTRSTEIQTEPASPRKTPPRTRSHSGQVSATQVFEKSPLAGKTHSLMDMEHDSTAEINISVNPTPTRTRSLSGQVIATQVFEKSPRTGKTCSLEDEEHDSAPEISMSVNPPSSVRTRSQSGQKSYNLRTKLSPKKSTQKEISTKTMLTKDSPAINEKVRPVRRASLATPISHSTLTEVTPREKCVKLQNIAETPKILSEQITQDGIIEEKVSEEREKVFASSREAEPQNETAVEALKKTQEKARKTPRRKTIKTTFIDDDRSEQSPAPIHTKSGRKTRFSFSHPTIIETEEVDYTLLQTPPSSAINYIFSPPLTRSKSRRSRKTPEETASDDSKQSANASRASISIVDTPRTPKMSSRRKSGSQSFSDTPINFISPVLESPKEGEVPTHSRRSSSILHRHGMTLRKQKGFLVTRKSARLD